MTESYERADPRAAARAAADPDAGRARVLIVDDDEGSRRVCADYCDLFDHACEAVGDAEAAVAALRRGPYDAIVVSVHMDKGLDAVRAMRALPAPAGVTPMIGLTALGRGGESQRWMAAGLSAVLTKPVTARRLFAALVLALDGAGDGPRSWAPAI